MEHINHRYRQSPAEDRVQQFLYLLQTRQWKVASQLCTAEAQVQGVTAEQPEKRWTRTMQQFLADKPCWVARTLHWQRVEHGGSCTVMVDWRQEHLLVRSRFELIAVKGDWKIDHFRYTTERQAPGSAEQWKKLAGIWEWDPTSQELESSILRAFKLEIQPDDFGLYYRLLGINLFGPPKADQECYHRDWQVKLIQQGTKWFLQLDWQNSNQQEGMLAEFEARGNELHLQIYYLQTKLLKLDQEPSKLVLKRKR